MARWLLALPLLLVVSAGLGALGDAFPGRPFPAPVPASTPAMNQPSSTPASPGSAPASTPADDAADDEPTPA